MAVADLTKKNQDDKTALDYANEQGHQEIIMLLHKAAQRAITSYEAGR